MKSSPTTANHAYTSAVSRRNGLWRGPALVGLLIALWLYVLPYQAGVRLDQSLSSWISDHPDWTFKRGERSLYQRHYQLRWQPDWATEPVVLDVQVFPKPFGWSSQAGRQWGWATFVVHMDPNSPVQIRYWPDRAIDVTGLVEGLGLVRFDWAGRQADNNRLTYNRSSHTWQGTLNLPGWQIHTPTHRYLFGRSLIDLHLHRHGNLTDSFWDGVDGELGIDVRRIGWGPASPTESHTESASGLIDHLQWRIRQMPDFSGMQRDVICSGTLDTLRLNGHSLGGGQLAFAVYAADPDFAERFAAMWQSILFTPDATSTRQALGSVLSALQSAEIRLDALRWQTPTGNMDISGKAFGPQFAGFDPLTNPHDHEQAQAPSPPPGLSPKQPHGQPFWQAIAQLQLGGTITQSPLIAPFVDWLDSWLPTPLSKSSPTGGTPVRFVLTYSPDGWVMNRSKVDSPLPPDQVNAP